ncbi:MAG: hypothetical protein WAV76_16675 [Bacteroidota bacterium]
MSLTCIGSPRAQKICILLFFLLSGIAIAQDVPNSNEMRRIAQQAQANPGQLKYQIMDVQEKDGIFTITYDLNDSPVDEYSVGLYVFRDNDPNFKLEPKTIRGDVGRGKFSGEGNQIIWDSNKDLKKPLTGNDFYFILYIKKIEPSHFPWTLLCIGGIAAGAAVYFLAPKPTSTASSPEIPPISISRP